MSGWEQSYDFGANQSQGFWDPNAASNYNYDTTNFSAPPPGNDHHPDLNNQTSVGTDEDFNNEPPLLEELGINLDHIVQKTLTVLNPMRSTRSDVAGDADLAGPLVFCCAFGGLLLFTGKVHFNYIYGIGAMGSVANYGLLSLMATAPVSFTVVVSVLGYCILPIVALSAISILISLTGPIGTLFTALAIIWSSWSASKLFVSAFDMEQQQLLVAYPCCMLYAVFALITMF